MDVKTMTDAELDELAIALKNEEQAFLADIKGRKLTVRNEIIERAEVSYTRQKLAALGIDDPSDELIAIIRRDNGLRLLNAGVVVTPETYHGTLEAQ